MEDMLKHMRCTANNPIKLACLNQSCKSSPFVCSQGCECYKQHTGQCFIKSIEQLSKDMLKVLHYQFLVMYSPMLKGSSIQVVGRYAEQILPRGKNHQIALSYDHISFQNNINQIYFRLKKIKTCVGVGVFIRQTLINNSFKYVPDHKYLNHGAYMLLSNNFLFSSSFEKQNCTLSQKINLEQNDTISVKIVATDNQHKIVFTQEKTGRKQELSLDWKEELTYHFGVYLYDQGDSVQIVNKRL